jgi:copper chaperone NosL
VTRRPFFVVVFVGLALVLGLVMGLGACAKSDQPVDPVWGKQPCAHCSMLVSDKRFAAQLVTQGGDRHYFDDIGCMVLWAKEHAGAAKLTWVRDAQTGQWLDARSARFAKGARTPMDYGFEARADGAASWADVETAVLEKEKGERK